MDADQFKRVLACFAESPESLDLSKGEFVVQLRDEVISARLDLRFGALQVVEGDVSRPAEEWLCFRVAKLGVLADRILSYTSAEPHFVSPSAIVLPGIDAAPTAAAIESANALAATVDELQSRTPGTTRVVYLTSDAGEGKTTLISMASREVAQDFKAKRRGWLMLPVPLGGRSFLRLDELVVSALMNRYRFQYWFYDAFIELVRMGVVVPAFDGFEEMIAEGSSGEAVSALGNLMKQLRSEGTVLFAARKAFFEYESFRTQAKLFDAIGAVDSVSFSRTLIERWNRSQFEAYGAGRGHPNPAQVFDRVAAKFGTTTHPLLTRAVLVRRLFDVALERRDVGALIDQLGSKPQDYFHEFVIAIVEREAMEKWPDKEHQGQEGRVLLSVTEHLTLLAAVAKEMWMTTTDSLRSDVVDAVAELYCEELGKSPSVARQVRNRIQQHALLVASGGARPGLSFDHEDFKAFFTGLALGETLRRAGREDIRTFLRVGSISAEMAEEAVLYYVRLGGDRASLVSTLVAIADGELPTSFVLENVGSILLRVVDGQKGVRWPEVVGLSFVANALRTRAIRGLRFRRCYFAPTSIYGSKLIDCEFVGCRFDRIELSPEAVVDSTLESCEVACVSVPADDIVEYDPASIVRRLVGSGFKYPEASLAVEAEESKESLDVDLELTERVVRTFLRATQVNEQTLRVRLGTSANYFFDNVIEQLVRAGVMAEVPYRGSGQQKRYRLSLPMERLQEAVSVSGGSFEKFLDSVSSE